MNPYEDAIEGNSGFATPQGHKENEAKRDEKTPDKTRDVRPRRGEFEHPPRDNEDQKRILQAIEKLAAYQQSSQEINA
eukprot:13636552-Heterocapsa_arctica.AAC.1